MPTRPARTTTSLTVPQGALAFAVWRVTLQSGKNAEGKKWTRARAERLKGDPDARGRVADAWPVDQFDPAAILARWGEGRYRVEFLDGKGVRVGDALDVTLAAPPPDAPANAAAPPLRPPAKKRPAAAADVDAEGDAAPVRNVLSRLAGGSDAFAFMMFLEEQRRDARAAERAEADARSDRDRAFFNTQLEIVRGMYAQRPGAEQAGGSPELLRRELAVEMREQSLALDKKITGMLERFAATVDTGDDDDDPPRTAKEAARRVGIDMIEELGEAGPDIVNGFIAVAGQYLRKRGIAVSPRMRKQIAELERAQKAAEAQAAAEDEQGDDDEGQDDDGEGARQ
jgi:hypothetical protein